MGGWAAKAYFINGGGALLAQCVSGIDNIVHKCQWRGLLTQMRMTAEARTFMLLIIWAAEVG